MSSPVEQIKERISITEVIGGYLKMEKAGSSYKARCPFHNEKTPSFFISPHRGTYYCFGCGAKGDMFSFVEQFEGVDFVGALTMLANRAGVVIRNERPEKRSERERLYAAMEEATKFFESGLVLSSDARAYLHTRGISDKTVEEWRLGFVRDEWRLLLTHLTKKGFSEQELEKAGLVKRSDDGKSIYDRFRSRIMFPIFDASGRPVAFSGRIFGSEKDAEAKYLNSPETPIFEKSKVLYGLHRAKEGIRKFNFSILVEGQMDILMMHQVGFSNAVASSGTAFSFVQADMLKRLSPNVVVAYDGDAAGTKAAVRSAKLLLARGLEVKIALFPEGVDPADLALSDKDGLKKAVKDSLSIIDFYLSALKRRSSDERVLRRSIDDELLPLVALMESAVAQSQAIARIASQISGVREEALWMNLRKISRDEVLRSIDVGTFSATHAVEPKPTERIDTLERRLLSILLWQEGVASPVVDLGILRRKWEEIAHEGVVTEKMAALTDALKHEMIFEAEAYYDGSPGLPDEVEVLFAGIQAESLKRELADLIKETEKAESEKDHLRAMSLLKRSQDVSKRLNKLGRVHKES